MLRRFGLGLILTLSAGCASNPEEPIRDLCLLTEQHFFGDAAIDAMTEAEAKREADHNDVWSLMCLEN